MADRVAVLSGGKVEQYDTPQMLYDRPMTRFVAGFLGSPSMNFLKGRLTTAAGPRLVHAGGDIDLTGYAFAVPAPTGEVELGIRPEALRLVAPHAGRLRGRVESIDLMGVDQIVWIDVEGEIWSARTDRGRSERPGDAVGLDFDAETASVYALDSGRRV